eukprot:6185444-Pleurochrysis_carterae.AAC.3
MAAAEHAAEAQRASVRQRCPSCERISRKAGGSCKEMRGQTEVSSGALSINAGGIASKVERVAIACHQVLVKVVQFEDKGAICEAGAVV